MLADELDFVIGVDSHRDAHALAFVSARTGALLAEAELPASAPGYRRALALAEWLAPARRLWAIEGTGSDGAGLTRFLAGRGERVLEIERRAREPRRAGAKSDRIDALMAARAALAHARLAVPRAAGQREPLRALLSTREGAVGARRAALNQLRALLVTAPEPLRARLRGLSEARLLAACTRLRPATSRHPGQRGLAIALRACARRVRSTSAEAGELKRELELLVGELAPQLLAEEAVGPICAAQLVVSWSHAGRFASEAGFARHAGAAPIPASSGQVVRSRLDRGGDRQLNRALHTILVARHKRHAPTIAYIERRRSEGKSVREALRCLKRFLARHLFRLLEAGPLAT